MVFAAVFMSDPGGGMQVPYTPWLPQEHGGEPTAAAAYATAEAAAKARGSHTCCEVRRSGDPPFRIQHQRSERRVGGRVPSQILTSSSSGDGCICGPSRSLQSTMGHCRREERLLSARWPSPEPAQSLRAGLTALVLRSEAPHMHRFRCG